MPDRHPADIQDSTSDQSRPIKGRGAQSNPDNRFFSRQHEYFDDGWDEPEAAPAVQTITLSDRTKTIITTNRSPDIGFDQSINPYRGCEHGCIYCYARPTHAYWDLSPGLDFESKIIIKPDAARLLRAQLDKPGYRVKPVCIGANTDPYQPLESRLKSTRSIIEVLAEYRHPFSIITKSQLIVRDLDLLAPLAAQNLCSVAISVTTLDNDLKRRLEPRTPSGARRLQAIRSLTEAGVRVTLLTAPVIPCLNDHELELIMAAGRDAGAANARYILLRLPLEVSELFREWLQLHYPDRADHVMSIIRQSRGGRDYRSRFGERLRGTGPFADLLHHRWQVACRKLGYRNTENREEHFELETSLFRKHHQQLTLF
ncbi:MAG: PA0069 family radical SAM protein [Proteobacteria bacterium]|nr:PA0069 family radical SAM protein [Pseudomonadota bacterium]